MRRGAGETGSEAEPDTDDGPGLVRGPAPRPFARHHEPMEDLVVVGVIGRPFGLRGELYVRPDPDIAHDFTPAQTYHAGERTLTVAATRMHSGRRLVRFVEASDREAAAGLRGLVLRVPRALVVLEDDAFWTSDVIGAQVVDTSGAALGVVEHTVDGHAHDYLVVARPDGAEVLIPAVAELIEISGGRVVVDPIPGLLDADDEA